jgi:hypothetical protein
MKKNKLIIWSLAAFTILLITFLVSELNKQSNQLQGYQYEIELLENQITNFNAQVDQLEEKLERVTNSYNENALNNDEQLTQLESDYNELLEKKSIDIAIATQYFDKYPVGKVTNLDMDNMTMTFELYKFLDSNEEFIEYGYDDAYPPNGFIIHELNQKVTYSFNSDLIMIIFGYQNMNEMNTIYFEDLDSISPKPIHWDKEYMFNYSYFHLVNEGNQLELLKQVYTP